ncbi:hypothetical protein N7326_05485 [Corynebacterium sp. ES2794-CONJ1]|uniref:hypothetical protein n=1 Tax=unclassified Corynebacterium TaxID=2624378 RepID=UPI002168A9E2|nr:MULTISPECIES: hypothetical protein [unclassified Corynebacterium]MCS4489815.1 hypothetical protein [Corynebacterium sp. ES2775-CONJ]MCS4491821.1 hypothetical protein [Corynebacterium sp. ES2715-CONJ3]MCU9519327.1 hypothetical protein [Corynebacterium sp. ES2794-CONJ1]
MGRKNRRANISSSHQLPSHGAAFFGTREVVGPRWAQGEIFLMRLMGSSTAKKYYICPGCNQNIPPGITHVVAWPKDYGGRAEDRRHWHRACWERR